MPIAVPMACKKSSESNSKILQDKTIVNNCKRKAVGTVLSGLVVTADVLYVFVCGEVYWDPRMGGMLLPG